MARTAFTLRLESDERIALESLSKIEGRPINQILNDAIKSYLSRRGEKERLLQASLERLREYRQRDPNFEQAIDAFVEAEMTIKDPLEGTVHLGHIIDGKLVQSVD
jgi:predicted transcriptional regulator